MCTIISVINNKGGVGKTTSTAIISELLAYLNKKVLVVDLDQQSNLSMLLGQYSKDTSSIIDGIDTPARENYNIAEIFKYRYKASADVQNVIKATSIPNLDIIPSSKRHKNTQLILSSNTGNNNIILKKALNSIRHLYDYILIDNAPANDILTVNSLLVSDMVIVPVRTEKFSYKGLQETIDTILYIKEEHDIDNIVFGGTFITQAEANTNVYKESKEKYEKELGVHFYPTSIRKDIKICEVETSLCPLLQYAPNTNSVFDYCNLLLNMQVLDEEAAAILRASIA